jgi:ABC transporter substrate binding protein (PQQ-dependent alcohol dehydrogenase system)
LLPIGRKFEPPPLSDGYYQHLIENGAPEGEIARVNSADSKNVFDYMKGPDFAVAAFKGRKLTVRDWDLQLRQPILLTDGRVIVSVSPQEGFLHQFSELDTLGIDRPETKCRLK